MIYLNKKIDFINDNIIIIGESNPGTLGSDTSWRIKQIEFIGTIEIITTWADGSDAFDKAWDNRINYQYL